MKGIHYTITARQLDLIRVVIARAEHQGAFKDCVVPKIGVSVLAMLEKLPVKESV